MTHDGLAIEGIDTEGALRRLGGKRERYEALLRKFADKQSGTITTVRAALAADDRVGAEREIHSLKGAAGSLGAIGIAEAAAEAEQSLKTNCELEASLRKLENSLAAVVASIRSKLPS